MSIAGCVASPPHAQRTPTARPPHADSTYYYAQAAVELSGQKRKAAAVGRSKRMQLGNSQLTKLWNMGSNSLEDIAANAAKSGVPSLVDFLKPVR